MTSFYLSHQASPLEGIIEYPSHISSSTPFTQESHEASACMCPIFFNPSSTQPGGHRGDQQLHQHNHDVTQVNKLDPNFLRLSLVPATDDDTKDYNNSNYKSSMIDEDGECSARWMPSKMRFMRKMMNSNNQIEKPTRRNNKALQNQQEPLMPPNEGSNISSRSSNGDPSNSPIRVCSDCQTTKTPLWRSGPCGPKSLCNACGIRQRKARRALAAAAMGGGGLITTEASSKVKKDDMGVNCTLPFKKRCKFMDGARLPKKHKPRCFDDEFTIRLSKSSAFHQVFPQDEREAAILLMALSCGLICG